MSRYRIYIIFFVIVLLGISGVFFVSSGYYPIALIGGDFISAREFINEYRTAFIYYENFLKTYNVDQEERLDEGDLQLAVINNLVEKSIVSYGVRGETGNDFDYLLENKLNDFSFNEELGNAVSNLYGMEREDFFRIVLIPQAEREILAGRLFLKGENIDDWLSGAKKSASVFIFSPSFKWDGEVVEES